MVCTKRAAPPYLNGREGYSECWANTELGLNWIVEMWKYARGDKEMSSLWKQWNISPWVIWPSETPLLTMAGIIAQLTRAARIRRDRKHYGTNKCLYTLEPFDTNGFKVNINLLTRYLLQVLSTFIFCPGWSSQQIHREEGAVGGAPEDDEGGGGHDHRDLQTVQGDDSSLIICSSCLIVQREKAAERRGQGRSPLLQCLEVTAFTALVLTLPTFLLATELLFYFGTIYIDTKLLGKFWNLFK